MSYSLPNGSTIDLASSYSTEVVVTSISNANPAVVTATAHGFEEGDIVLLVIGWSKLTNRALVVGDVTTDTFELQGVDTTSTVTYPAGGGLGTAKSGLTYLQIPQIVGVEFAGGDQNWLDIQFLEDDTQRQLPTVKTAISMTLTVADDEAQPFVPVVRGYDEDKSVNIVRLNLINGSTILYPAILTMSDTPTVNINELLTNTIALAVQGKPTRYVRT